MTCQHVSVGKCNSEEHWRCIQCGAIVPDPTKPTSKWLMPNVKKPRDILLGQVQIAKQKLLDEITGGERNYNRQKELLRDYQELLHACDVLGGTASLT